MARVGEDRNAYRVLVGKPDGGRKLGKARRRWEGNSKIDIKEMRWKAWNGLIWLRLHTQVAGCCKAVINCRVP